MATKWTREAIIELLHTNDRAVERALLTLLARQTSDEQVIQQTKHHNLKGFTPYDAKIMTSMAQQVKRGFSLTLKQLAWLRGHKSDRFPSRIGKYARQLLKVVKEKEEGK